MELTRSVSMPSEILFLVTARWSRSSGEGEGGANLRTSATIWLVFFCLFVLGGGSERDNGDGDDFF